MPPGYFSRFSGIIILIVMLILALGCEKQQDYQDRELVKYASFREVPGVTQEEIQAIEALQREFDFFVYGMPLSTEAFINEAGELRGFTALYCEWLTELFGIRFVPRLYEWLDLLEGLETTEISFSGELTSTPERQRIYQIGRAHV